MKYVLFFALALIGASNALDLTGHPLDGHQKLHEAMKTIMHDLSGTKFPEEMKEQVNRTQRILVGRIHPYLTTVGIRVRDPLAYHSLLQHLVYEQSRNFVNTSKALDNMAEASVLRMHKAQLLKTQMVQLTALQRRMAFFLNQLHNYIGVEAQKMLRKHGVRLAMPHVHFLVHICARALFKGGKVQEVVSEQLRVVADQKMSPQQQKRLHAAGLELALRIQQQVRVQLHYQLKNVLAAQTPVTTTHPIFVKSALEQMEPLLHQCKKHHLHRGHHYEHYRKIAHHAFGPNAHHHDWMTPLMGNAGPITLEHMNRVAMILRRHHQNPQPSVIGYLGAYHLRPEDEMDRPWYKCLLTRMGGLFRVVWLVFAVVLGAALLFAAIMLILSKKRAKLVVVKKSPAKEKSPSKLPYVSLIEEKVPIEA